MKRREELLIKNLTLALTEAINIIRFVRDTRDIQDPGIDEVMKEIAAILHYSEIMQNGQADKISQLVRTFH